MEIVACDRHRRRHFDHPLQRIAASIELARKPCFIRCAEMAQESQCRFACDPWRRRLPVLAAFDQQRGARIALRRRRTRSRAAACPRRARRRRRCAPASRAPAPAATPLCCRPAIASGGQGSVIEWRSSRIIDALVQRPQLAGAREVGASAAGLSSTSAVHSRLKSSSTQRDANGSAAIEALVRGDVGEARTTACRAPGGIPSRSSQSSAIAPQTSLPCVSAWSRTCGPARRGEGPDVAECRCCRRAQRARSGNADLDRWRAPAIADDRAGRCTGARVMSAQTRSASRRMNASHCASCSSATHSFGWCACAMWPGSADDRRDRGVVEQRCLGAERYLAEVARAAASASQLGDLAVAVGVEARSRRQARRTRCRCRRDTACIAGSEVARAYGRTSAKSASGSSNGRWRNLEIEAAVARHDVEGRPAVDHARMHRRVRHVVRGVESRRVAEARAHLGQLSDDLAGDLHGVDAVRRQRRMRLVAAHAAAPALLALVRDDEFASRSARRRCSRPA